ncbi:hypothetical protein C9J01_27515 [Photobacterium rosenbergii]|uniref:DUF2959 domain-containing protein n=1 Tax=Photobacterium rosenbergii TaxID=294936 RepID=A0A2T3MZ94_9GAMM|nr:hypothetical protein [Photobacterium rosenbergii]PSW05304.1 hypothetical protein C9J01_27515 [Photobacterium rosenbergii]
MKIKTLSIALGSLLLSACTSTVGVWDDRDEILNELANRCAEHSETYTSATPTIDTGSRAVLTIVQRQCAVKSQYRNIRANHKDVEQFFAMHNDLSNEEVAERLASNPEMQAKFNQYTAAQDKIFSENLELAIQLGVQAAEVGLLYAENAQQIAILEAAAILNNAIEDSEENNTAIAAKEMKERVDLIAESNNLILAEKRFIDDMKAADAAIKERMDG